MTNKTVTCCISLWLVDVADKTVTSLSLSASWFLSSVSHQDWHPVGFSPQNDFPTVHTVILTFLLSPLRLFQTHLNLQLFQSAIKRTNNERWVVVCVGSGPSDGFGSPPCRCRLTHLVHRQERFQKSTCFFILALIRDNPTLEPIRYSLTGG